MHPYHPLLGDGTHTDHFFFFADYLEANPGSLKKAKEIEKSQNTIEKHNKTAKSMNLLKPPSASIIESQLSHALGSIARDKKIIGAALYNTHGLRVANWGVQHSPIRLNSAYIKKLKNLSRKTENIATECKSKNLRANNYKPVKLETCFYLGRKITSNKDNQTVVGFSEIVFDQTYADLYKDKKVQ